MREIRMCVVFLPANEKKNLSIFWFWRPLGKKTRERTREKRDLFQRNLFSFTTLISSSLNQLSRTNEGTRNTRRALTTEKEERGPRFRERAEQSFCGEYLFGCLLFGNSYQKGSGKTLFFFSSLIRADRDRKKESSDVRTVHPTEIVAILVRYMRRDTDFKEKMVLRRVRRLRHLRQLPPDAKRAAVEKNE